MKIFDSTALTSLMVMVFGVSLLGVAEAQEQDFPREREGPISCSQVDWNQDMIRNHPRLIEACREVVHSGGANWARFEAKYVRVESNGDVTFSIRDANDRHIESVGLVPAPGQVAYIDDNPTPFSQLQNDQLINLYVPEGMYGFVTQPGVPATQVAAIKPVPAATQTVAPQPRVATRAATLPATAGPVPWVGLGGLIALFGALGMTLTRRRALSNDS